MNLVGNKPRKMPKPNRPRFPPAYNKPTPNSRAFNKRWPPPIKPTKLSTQINDLQTRADPLANAKLAQLERQFRQLQEDLSKATVENKALQAQFTQAASQATSSPSGPNARETELTQQLATAQARISELENSLKPKPPPHHNQPPRPMLPRPRIKPWRA